MFPQQVTGGQEEEEEAGLGQSVPDLRAPHNTLNTSLPGRPRRVTVSQGRSESSGLKQTNKPGRFAHFSL